MKTQITSLELHYILSEAQCLVNGKLNKLYQSDNNFIFQFHVPGLGNKKLMVSLPNCIYLTDYKPIIPRPPNFCMVLRKYLTNSCLRSIKQIKSERVIELLFEKQETYILILELFSKGNVILCKHDYSIIYPLYPLTIKSRTIRGGLKYQAPEQSNFFKLTQDELKGQLERCGKESLVKALAVSLGFGGVYAEELCLLAELDKTKKPDALTDKELESLHKSIKLILTKKIAPLAVLEGDQTKDIVPFELKYYGGFETRKFNSYNQAFDFYFTKSILEQKQVKAEEEHSNELNKIQRIIDSQTSKITELNDFIGENQRKAEFIYEHYIEITNILEGLKKARQKLSWQEIKDKLKGNSVVKEINEKEKRVVIELKDQ